MKRTQEELINEEQKILDDLIHDMDEALMELDKKLTYNELQTQKAKEACLPDAYGMLVMAEQNQMEDRKRMRNLYEGKDELYETRLVVDITDEKGNDEEEIKVGLHTYARKGHNFITSWKMPVCRHYLLDNSAEEYDSVFTDKHGKINTAHYHLKLKRRVEISFDKVNSVIHFYPITDQKVSKIIADEFLQELLRRRSGQEFKNIVFSIQKRQGEIIQTPFKQNLIVQGCAGSGKSMIMIHRLPIVIYDNPNSLDRNNMYIITPSITYIQMANNMRIDLEVEDLKMGTLRQYYDYALGKYRCKPEVYGMIRPDIKLDETELKYIYSKKCIDDITNKIEQIIENGEIDLEKGYLIFGLAADNDMRPSFLPADRIRKNILKIQSLIDVNDAHLREFHRNIYSLLKQMDDFARMLENQKEIVQRGVLREFVKVEKKLAELKKKIEKMANPESRSSDYKSYVDAIQFEQKKMEELIETKDIVAFEDDYYFAYLKEKAGMIRKFISFYAIVKEERMEMSLDEQYYVIGKRNFLCASCEKILSEIVQLEDPYEEYTNSNILSGYRKLSQCYDKILGSNDLFLPQDYVQCLLQTNAFYSDAIENTVQKVYLSIMKGLGQESDQKGRLNALECSPYLYLQILFLFYGVPNDVKESLITIDEAQNIEPEELRLIKSINGDQLVLNLFGDVRQHVEGSKGIDDWSEIAQIADFKIEYLKENYRNARQITEFCNKRFGLQMRAINLDGTGVHQLQREVELKESLLNIFQKPQKIGLSCIIVKDKDEAQVIKDLAGHFEARIHDMTSEVVELQKMKWNLVTVEQAKGLEFETVFAITGRMSENEKYIAYTRALDELYIYDQKISIVAFHKNVVENKEQMNGESKGIRRKRVKRSSKEL